MLLAVFTLSFSWISDSAIRDTKIEVPSVYKNIYGAKSITSDGKFVYIKTNGTPDHKSIYYSKNDSLYQDFSGTTFGGRVFRKNPNQIEAQSYTFKIPLNPQVSSVHKPTPLGPIGVAINGVPFFNQYAGPDEPLSREAGSFDQYRGHPARRGDYHYHVEPLYLTTVKANKSALLGFLLDGFPVYGPEENSAAVNEKQLDEYHGHFGKTLEYPEGTYHYHVTNQDPYINGSGFYGSPGTISR